MTRPLPGARPTKCDRCRAAIVWAVTEKNKAMPLDAAVDETGTGNVAVMLDAHRRLRARVLSKGEQPYGYERRAMPHFATCNAQRKQNKPAGLPPGVTSIFDAPSRKASSS